MSTQTTTHELIDDLQRAYDGDPWHGPSLAALLNDVSAVQAAAHPVTGAHSIWELVLHLTAWTKEVARRLGGGLPAEPVEGDWPPVPEDAMDDAWRRARLALGDANALLVDVVREMSPEMLSASAGDVRDPVLGSGLTRAGMIRGLSQHHAYHGGQIAILKKIPRRIAT